MNHPRAFGPGAKEPQLAAGTNLPDAVPRTALPVGPDGPRHLEAHFGRLQAGAALLGHAAPWLPGVQAELRAWLVEVLQGGEAALRLVLHPDRGILLARLEPLPAAPDPCRLVPMPHPLWNRRLDPAAPHKGLTGPWPSEAWAEARRRGGEDALLLWPDGTLAETAIAAVALETGDALTLPPPEGRVASLAERLDLPRWAAARGLRVVVAPIPFGGAACGRLWCMNALRGIWPAILL